MLHMEEMKRARLQVQGTGTYCKDMVDGNKWRMPNQGGSCIYLQASALPEPLKSCAYLGANSCKRLPMDTMMLLEIIDRNVDEATVITSHISIPETFSRIIGRLYSFCFRSVKNRSPI